MRILSCSPAVHRKKRLDLLHFRCYTTSRLTKQVRLVETQSKTPSRYHLLGVSSAFTEQSTEAGYRNLLLSVQPFAYVMADYTCHNGKNPRSKYFHSGNTSFLSQIAPDRSGNDSIISCIPKISRKDTLTPPSRRGRQSHADDSKDLCVYLDDRHGFTAAVLIIT